MLIPGIGKSKKRAERVGETKYVINGLETSCPPGKNIFLNGKFVLSLKNYSENEVHKANYVAQGQRYHEKESVVHAALKI